MIAKRNWFDKGQNYARFRPMYPADLTEYLSSLCGEKSLAVDVGCGTGQLTTLLASEFRNVVGLDSSEDQIRNAVSAENVAYVQSPAEALPIEDGSADLVTAAQAAHWFDRTKFYEESRRITKPNAVLALLCYSIPRFENVKVDELFQDLYFKQLGEYWSPVLKLVDEEYRTLDFPFESCGQYSGSVSRVLTYKDVLGYVSTWSAARAVEVSGEIHILDDFAEMLEQIWPESETIASTWFINSRIGRLGE